MKRYWNKKNLLRVLIGANILFGAICIHSTVEAWDMESPLWKNLHLLVTPTICTFVFAKSYREEQRKRQKQYKAD